MTQLRHLRCMHPHDVVSSSMCRAISGRGWIQPHPHYVRLRGFPSPKYQLSCALAHKGGGMAVPFVAVHAGAGCHNESTSRELKALCRRTCKEVLETLKAGKSANEAVALAVSILEDSPLTNAGIGSNLSLTGTVECDASIMDGNGGYGAVGAIKGITNPVNVAHKLFQESSQGSLSLGRVPPLMLVGVGAQQWAKQHGFPICDPDELITDRAQEVYLDHKSRLDGASEPARKRRRVSQRRQASQQGSNRTCAALDTVGAICVDGCGHVAASVSSGGISLKFPGRVGQAASFGCGCWADNQPGPQSRGVACSTSGTGEYIVKTMLARECAMAMMDSTLHQALDEHFINSRRLLDVEQKFKLAGVIALNISMDGVLHFSWGHTTESMCIGYLTSYHNEPTIMISKMDCPDKAGTTSHVEAIRFPSRHKI